MAGLFHFNGAWIGSPKQQKLNALRLKACG
jgi:hypothetical protein